MKMFARALCTLAFVIVIKVAHSVMGFPGYSTVEIIALMMWAMWLTEADHTPNEKG